MSTKPIDYEPELRHTGIGFSFADDRIPAVGLSVDRCTRTSKSTRRAVLRAIFPTIRVYRGSRFQAFLENKLSVMAQEMSK